MHTNEGREYKGVFIYMQSLIRRLMWKGSHGKNALIQNEDNIRKPYFGFTNTLTSVPTQKNHC